MDAHRDVKSTPRLVHGAIPVLALLTCHCKGSFEFPEPDKDVILSLSELEFDDLDPDIFPPSELFQVHALSGVVGGPAPMRDAVVDLTSAYQRIGVDSVRTHDLPGPLDLSVMYSDFTSPGNYSWEASNAALDAITEGGFQVYLRLGESTPLTDSQVPLPEPGEQTDGWLDALREVLLWYDVKYPEERGEPSRLTTVEVWNEPDLPAFWDTGPTGFATLFATMVETVNSAPHEHLAVGGPGFSDEAVSSTWFSQFRTAYLTLINAKEPEHRHKLAPDFVSWHYFADSPGEFESALDSMADKNLTFWNIVDDQHGAFHVSAWGVETDIDTAEGERWSPWRSQVPPGFR